MHDSQKKISFILTGRYALFSDPALKVGGEKYSYHLPTYEAIKGVLRSIYWKPTLIWHVDKVRVLNPIMTETKGILCPKYTSDEIDRFHYTYLKDVAYEVEAHFEWNMLDNSLAADRNLKKHADILQRSLNRGGRRDIFLGSRECQGYVEPCEFGSNPSAYDAIPELSYGPQFHSFGYPEETGKNQLIRRFWNNPVLKNGVIEYPSVSDSCLVTSIVRRTMTPTEFKLNKNVNPVDSEDV